MTVHTATLFPRRSAQRVTQSGFSMIEIVLAIALMTIMSVLTIPAGLRFFEMQALDETAETFRATLRSAKVNASSGFIGSGTGVALFPEYYVLFAGESYADRDPLRDTVIPLEGGVTIEGPSEVVFARMSGIPNAPTEFTVSLSDINPIVLSLGANGLTTFE